MVWAGAHNAPIQSPYAALPVAIIASKEKDECTATSADIFAHELSRSKRFRVRSIDAVRMHGAALTICLPECMHRHVVILTACPWLRLQDICGQCSIQFSTSAPVVGVSD